VKERNTTALRGALLGLVVAAVPAASQATTITGWNTSNVEVGPVLDTTNAIGDSGASVVYDEEEVGGTIPTGAESSGQIVYTWDESNSPGIKVVNEEYPDSASGNPPTILDGCIMASSTATCDDGFQSGKRIKQQVTDFGPVDLVFDVAPDAEGEEAPSIYQVFGRLINVTGEALTGFKIELGFGVGDGFTAAGADSGLSFSTVFTAQPGNSGPVSTQFPFGLFGDAEDSPNFLLDGFFDDERTGFDVDLFASLTAMESIGYYGNYANLFGDWNDQGGVPEGLFWDFDNDPTTDALLMAWQRADGLWELRRGLGETCEAPGFTNCTPGVTLDPSDYETFSSFEDVAKLLTDSADCQTLVCNFIGGGIEDLANLNLNFAIALDAVVNFTSFTLRTTVYPVDIAPVPLPAGAPLLLAALGAFAALRRRKTLAATV